MINHKNSQNLLTFTTQLLETVTADEVAKKFISIGLKLFGADAGSIVILKDNVTLRIIRAHGYKPTAVRKWKEFSITATIPIADAVKLKKPIFISTQKKLKRNYEQLSELINLEKTKSWAALPIIYRKKVLGGIGLSFNKERKFTQNDKTYFLTITQQISQALERAKLYEAEKEARTSIEASRARIRFLNEATKILASSLDYKKTLANLAKIVTPHLAEWCGIDIVTDEGKLQNIVVAHKDPEKVKWAKVLQKKYPADLSTNSGVARVISTGKPELYSHISQNILLQSARDEEHLKMLKSIGFKSIMIVPLIGQNKTLGAISFIASGSEKHFTKEDLFFAEELAARAANAIDNAILYQKSLEGIRIRDEFLNIASHELKTPLTSLQLQMQLLMSLASDTSSSINVVILKKLLAAGEQQTKRLGNLITNLLDVSRMTGKKIELEKAKFELNMLIAEVVDRFESTLKHSGSKVIFENHEKIIGKWDKFKLDQVATNLLSNAIKYGNGKNIKISLKKENEKAVLMIKDKGMGMRKEEIKKIFDRFVRTEAAKKYGGLGLGLYISKQIVEAHKGNISVSSSPQQGTEFTIKLPLN